MVYPFYLCVIVMKSAVEPILPFPQLELIFRTVKTNKHLVVLEFRLSTHLNTIHGGAERKQQQPLKAIKAAVFDTNLSKKIPT